MWDSAYWEYIALHCQYTQWVYICLWQSSGECNLHQEHRSRSSSGLCSSRRRRSVKLGLYASLLLPSSTTVEASLASAPADAQWCESYLQLLPLGGAGCFITSHILYSCKFASDRFLLNATLKQDHRNKNALLAGMQLPTDVSPACNYCYWEEPAASLRCRLPHIRSSNLVSLYTAAARINMGKSLFWRCKIFWALLPTRTI